MRSNGRELNNVLLPVANSRAVQRERYAAREVENCAQGTTALSLRP